MQGSGLTISYDEVVSIVVERLEADEMHIEGFEEALKRAEGEGLDREYAATFLVGLEAAQIWYLENRPAYEHAKALTEGNSVNAYYKQTLVRERRENNRSAFSRKKNLILFGYMRACGEDKIAKRCLAPLTDCLRVVLLLSDYELRGDDAKEKVYKVLYEQGRKFRKKERNPFDLGYVLFDEIHSIRTGPEG